MRVTGKGVGDQLPDQGCRLGGGFLALLRALVAAALLASACLLSLGHVSRGRSPQRSWLHGHADLDVGRDRLGFDEAL